MFYSIGRSDDLKEIGYYPQADLGPGYNPRQNGHFMVKHYEFPDFIPNLELDLHPKANATNYLDSTAGLTSGFIVDAKFKEILSSFKLPRHHFYQIKVFHNEKVLDYYWLHYIVDDFYEFIDKENSYCEVFEIKTPFEMVVQSTFPIISRDQVLNEKKKHKFNRTRIGRIVMKNNFPKYDLYQTQSINYISLISENLKRIFEEEHITGMEIKPFDKFEIYNSF